MKERDHLMDAMRYLEMELPGLGQVAPQLLDPGQREIVLGRYSHGGPGSWMR